ncbi:MAG: ABC transporter permease [Prevotellaceae bacterium]|jgi:ABC-2 type transport system permease protein|nr:ABC transporter permease [Prevotellaceae bacterium]
MENNFIAFVCRMLREGRGAFRVVCILIQKEFKQIFRNRSLLPVIFVVPLLQLLILPWAATFEMKEVKMHVVDLDHSPQSRALVGQFAGSPFFRLVDASQSYAAAERDIIGNRADVALEIPPHFESDLVSEGAAKVHVTVNAINSTAAALASAYSLSVVNDFNAQQAASVAAAAGGGGLMEELFWYNPRLDYPTYMAPGILVMLVAIIGLFLSSMNMVREKEIGTMEQLNVTPVRKYQLIIGKFFPFWIFALIDATLGLLLARWVYGISIVGSIALIYLLLVAFLLAVLGVGLFFSAISRTQQQAMFMAWFFVMIFVLLSGLFTPVESMPDWARRFNAINPFAYGIKAIRMVMLKGSSFADVRHEFYALLAYAAVSLTLAVNRYKKTA